MIALRNIAAKAAAIAFAAAADVLQQWRLRYGTATSAHNPATDATTTTWTRENTVDALPYSAKQDRPTPDATPTTHRMLAVRGAQLTAPAELAENAEAQAPDGTIWQVVEVSFDPALAAYILTLRQ